MLSIYTTAFLAYTIFSCAAQTSPGFTVSTPFRLVASHESSPIRVTDTVVQIRRGNTPSIGSEYLRAIRAGAQADGIYTRLQSGNTSITGVESGNVFLTPITAGGQNFEVVIDTGSSDTWFVEGNFSCLDPATSNVIPQADCQFGPSYSLSHTAHVIANRNFNISYADGEFLNGAMLYENITLAGIAVPQQEIALVDHAAWYGDGISSGLVGLAYASLTNQYAGTNASADQPGAHIPYDPIFTTMHTQNLTLPLFSLALQRSGPNSATSAGGVLAIGGIPAVPHDPYFANASIQIVGIDSATGGPLYQFYTVALAGWAYSNSSGAQFDVHHTGNPARVPLAPASPTAVVDSGTSLVYAPPAVAAAVAALYAPPATYDAALALYTVDCAAAPPVFGVVIAEKVLYVNPVDLVVDGGGRGVGGVCVAGVQSNAGGLTILGDVFLRNVLAVFDVGAGEMRFAAR